MQSPHEFLMAVLPVDGMPCIAWLSKGKNGTTYTKHRVYANIGELSNDLPKLEYTKYDYYFCISSLNASSINVRGKDRVRVKENMRYTRSFVLDIDIKDKEGFPKTKEEGLEELSEAIEKLNLPNPIVVDSGGGYHVYWPCNGEIPSREWELAAARFKKALSIIAPKLVADGSRVADCAGILRIPDSFNHKFDPLAPVVIHQWSDETLDFASFNEKLELIAGPATKHTVDLSTKVLETEPKELIEVAKKCNWVKQYLKHKDTESEPGWYAMLGLAKYLKISRPEGDITGLKLAQLLSKGHPGYSESNTEKKYFQVIESQRGPTLCSRFEAIQPDRCKGCPFWGVIKTPLQVVDIDKPATKPVKVESKVTIGGETTKELITIPLPPKPYFRGESGGVYVRTKKKDDEGNWTEVIDRVYDHDMYPVKRIKNESSESEYMEVHLWLPKDGLRKFRLPNAFLADSKTLAKFLSEKGAVADFGKANDLTKYLVQYVRYLQMQEAAEVEFSRFGWRDVLTASPKFVLSDGYMDVKGDIYPGAIAPYLKDASKAVSAQGSVSEWRKGFALYEGIPNSSPYILAAMLGFAAPLLALTGFSGVLYNMVGHSGGGKSTALEVMTSVWGKPNAQHVLINDTNISIFNFIGYLNNVPVAFDELTKIDGDIFSSFILYFTGGRGKMRAGRDGANKQNEVEWDTIVCSTSNTSLYDKLAQARKGYNAEAMRVFELNVQQSDPRYKPRVDRCINILRENHGVAGREYLAYIIPRISSIKTILGNTIQKITMRAKLRNEERFWGALLACVFVGGIIARDKLHLHNYNVEELIDTVLGVSDEVRTSIQSTTSDAVSTLAEFFNTNLNALLIMDNGQQSLTSAQRTLNSVKARLEYINKAPQVAYVSVASIREYCARHSIDPSWLRRELIEKEILSRGTVQRRLATGTTLPNVNLRAWEIKLDHPLLVEAMDAELLGINDEK